MVAKKKVAAKGASKGRSLVEFSRAKRREKCPVCQLPDTIRSQIKAAREKHIARDVLVEWLTKECGFKLSAEDLLAHTNGKHS